MTLRRKLTAIVAADIVGYSKRLSEDESGTLAGIEKLRTHIVEPHLAKHSGRIFRLLGDSTLLEFESALGAVEFATQVQQCLASQSEAEPKKDALVLRMGLDLGDVVVEENEIHGEGINVAVRLEEIAEPGGICLSDGIHAQIRKRFDPPFFPIGQRTLKNIAEPVQVWRWRPRREIGAPREQGGTSISVQKVLDPQVTDLILRLHARSAQLAISNALDDVLAGSDQESRQKADSFYERIGDELALARSMLDRIQIEPADQFREIFPSGQTYQSLNAFISAIFQERGNAYLMRLMPEAHRIMKGTESMITKRRLFLDMVRRFHDEEFVVRSKGLIKTAFVE
jgi:class 3 adenylate cyclase